MIENIELVSMLNKEIVIFGDLNFNYKLDKTTNALDSETLNTLMNTHVLRISYIVKHWKMSCLRLMFIRDGIFGKMNS